MSGRDIQLEPVVGLEIHAQLLTTSKMFCGCSAAYSGAAPNTHCCAVCTGMPGALPTINARALELGLLAAVALNCDIAERSKFDRKNYSYPDLPKGYQISQYDEPIGRSGYLDFRSGTDVIRWGIIRIHLEEDTGKSLHQSGGGSLVDYNRSGVPLMEIVTTPERRTPAEARLFFESLRQVLMYLGVNDGNLQEGSLRADVNVSLGPPEGALGTKVEVKNLNSFRALERALEYEIARQGEILRAGKAVAQETRGWQEKEERTVGQRSKEYAHDYRYFPEPDLPPLRLGAEVATHVRERLPELPSQRLARFEHDYGLPAKAATVLTAERPLADFYERTVAAAPDVPHRLVANWVTNEVLRLAGERGLNGLGLDPDNFADLLKLVDVGELSASAGKRALEEMLQTGESARAVVERLDLKQVGDETALAALVDEVLRSQPALVETYRRGKTNVLQAMVGQVMKASKGKANPAVVRQLIETRLTSP